MKPSPAATRGPGLGAVLHLIGQASQPFGQLRGRLPHAVKHTDLDLQPVGHDLGLAQRPGVRYLIGQGAKGRRVLRDLHQPERRQGAFAGCTYNFECKAADETKGIADMFVPLEDQAEPTYVAAARGGHRIITAGHGSTSIYHIKQVDFRLSLAIEKACNDGDVGYTCVDVDLDGIQAGGSISFEDASVASSKLKAQQLLLAAPASLVLTARQAQAATSKLVTIAGVDFADTQIGGAAQRGFSAHSLKYDITNDVDTQLTLAGDNKIITIANVA